MTKEEIYALNLSVEEQKVVTNTFTAAERFKRECALIPMNEEQVRNFIANKLAANAKKKAVVKANKYDATITDAVDVIFNYAVEYSLNPISIFEELIEVKKANYNAEIDAKIARLEASKL